MRHNRRVRFIFFVAVSTRLGAPPTRKSRKLARQPTEPTEPFAYMARTATAFTERRYRTVLRKRLRKRIRMNENVKLETRH